MDVKSLKRETVTTGSPSGRAPGFAQAIWIFRYKHMISRRLGASSAFFNPFLSQKGLISRQLRGFARKNSQGKSAANQTDRKAFLTANPDNYRGKWTRMDTNGKGASAYAIADFGVRNGGNIGDAVESVPTVQKRRLAADITR